MVKSSLTFLVIAGVLSAPATAQSSRTPERRSLAPRVVTLESLKGPAPVTLAQLEATLQANGLQWRLQTPSNLYVYQHPALPGCGQFRRPADAGKNVISQPARDQAIRVLSCVEQKQKPMVAKQW